MPIHLVRSRLVLALCSSLSLAGLACDGGEATTQPDEIDDDLGEGELSGQGPGGIGAVTSGMADADPEVIEAESLLAEGKHRQALELIDAAIAENPAQPRYYYVRGNALTYLDDNAGAEAAYQKAIELDPDDPLPHYALGQLIAFRKGATQADKERAAELFQTALKLNPELAPAHQSLGVVLLALGQPQLAVEALETAERLAGSVETAYLLAQAHGELGNFDQAVDYARSAVEFEPGASGVDLRLLHARLLMKKGDHEASAREFEQVAKLVPDSPPLRLEVARGLLELARPDAAMVHMQWLLGAVPKEIPVIVNHARVLVAQGHPKQAIARFDEALAQNAGSRAALTYKIEAQVAAKQCKDARKTFATLAKALDQDPKKALAQDPESLPRALEKGRRFLKPCK